jgi:hypothetical protein
MKKQLLKALAAFAIIGATSHVQAYSYTFSNHTNKEIGVAMRFYGLGEPRYFRWIPSHEGRQFTPKQATRSGMESEQPIEGRKIGFIAKTWWYVINPSPANKSDREVAKTLPWREFQITWMPTDAYKVSLKLYEAVTAATVKAAELAIDAAIAIGTEGASVPVQAALKAAKEGAASDALTNLIRTVGEAAGRSMMTDRHIDIIEDKNGIKFISLM